MNRKKCSVLLFASIVGLTIGTVQTKADEITLTNIAGYTPIKTNPAYNLKESNSQGLNSSENILLYEIENSTGRIVGSKNYDVSFTKTQYGITDSNAKNVVQVELDYPQNSNITFSYIKNNTNSAQITATNTENSYSDLYYNDLTINKVATTPIINNGGKLGDIKNSVFLNGNSQAIELYGSGSGNKYDTGSSTGNIENCYFFANSNGDLYNNGASIDLHKGSNLAGIKSSVFINNVAKAGGAINVSDYSKINSISNSDFIGNIAMSSDGGAIRVATNSIVENIDANFLGNSTFLGNGGAISLSENSSIKELQGDFISNYARKYGGAIYASSSNIDNLKGDFIENSAVVGGAIYNNNGTIKNITANFIDNKAENTNNTKSFGGAIYSNGSISISSSNFVDNAVIDTTAKTSSNQNSPAGGAIHGEGTIDIQNSIFNKNYVKRGARSSYYGGGAISINNSATLNITADNGLTSFAGNYVTSDDTAFGGAIATSGGSDSSKHVNITAKNGGIVSFVDNYVNGAKTALGGAIALTQNSTLNLTATNANSQILFDNNYAQVGSGDKVSSAIWVNNSNAKLNFTATDSGSILFNDAISGVSGYNIKTNGDSTGNITFNNDVKNAVITHSGSTLNLDTSNSNLNNTTSEILSTSTLNVIDGNISTEDGAFKNYIIKNIDSSNDARYTIDLDIDANSNSKNTLIADTFTITESGSGTIYLSSSTIENLLQHTELDSIKGQVLQIIKFADNAENKGLQLAFDSAVSADEAVASANMINTDVLTGGLVLETTDHKNDSITILGDLDALAEWAEFKPDPETTQKTFTFVNSDNYNLTRDIESLAGEKLTIQGSSNKNTIDLQGHNLLSSIGKSQELSINNITLASTVAENATNNGIVANSGTLNLDNVTLNTGLTNKDNATLNISNKFDGTGAITNLGTVNLSGDASGYKETYTQNNGTTNVTGQIFGGDKNINGGTLNITSDNLNYDKITLGSGTNLNHYSTVANGGTIDKQFTWASDATGATATFGKYATTDSEGTSSDFAGNVEYTLTNDTASKDNTIAFVDSTVKLKNTEYNGNYKIENSIIDLTSNNSPSEYKFTSLSGNGGLNIDVNFVKENDEVSIKHDTINTGSGYATFDLNDIRIFNDGNNNSEKQTITVISGGNDTNGKSKFTGDGVQYISGSTTVHNYVVTSKDQQVTLQTDGPSNENSLYHVTHEVSGDRFFGFSNTSAETETYNIGKSIDRMLTGTLKVYGVSKDKSILSGKIANSTDNSDKNGSFFHIVAPETGSDDEDKGQAYEAFLQISDLTIQDAKGTNGSVVWLDNENSTAILENTNIQNNQATENGGAFNVTNGELAILTSTIQNNIATENGGALFNDKNGKVYIENTTFTENGADKGGAIYNAGELFLNNVTLSAPTDTAKNDIYNIGTILIEGTKNTFESEIQNDTQGQIKVVSGTNEFSNISNNGEIKITNGTNTLSNIVNEKDATLSILGGTNSIGALSNAGTTTFGSAVKSTSEKSTIENTGTVKINSDLSGFVGSYSQTGGTTTVLSGANFFGGTSQISGGELVWNGNDIANDAKLTVSGGSATINSTLTLNTDSSISKDVATTIKGTVNVAGGDLYLDSGDTWNSGKVNLSDGNVTFDGNKNSGTFVQSGGTSTLINGSNVTTKSEITGGTVNIGTGATTDSGKNILTVDVGSKNKTAIADSVSVNIASNTDKLVVSSGIANINTTDGATGKDTWVGTIETSKNSVLNYTGTTNGIINAIGGDLNINGNGSVLTVDTGSSIADAVNVSIAENTTLDIKAGSVSIDNNDSWDGKVSLNGGTLNYKTDKNGLLIANTGNLNLVENSVLTIAQPSTVEKAVVVDIQKGATVNLDNNSIFNLDKEDKWNGLIVNDGGILTVDNLSNPSGGGLQQSSGSSTFTNNANITIADTNSYITGGDVTISDNSHLTFASGMQELNVENLNMSNNSTLHMINNSINNSTANSMNVNGLNNKTIDIAPRDWKSDKITINTDLTGSGTLNVSDFNFIGLAPIDRNIKLQVFDVAGEISEDVSFIATDKKIFTPIGNYELISNGGGSYTAHLASYNPQVFRGQVATLAMYNNQLNIDDIVLNHAQLHSERGLAYGKDANKYASANVLFAPYQYTREEGGLWFKSYVDIERLSMTQNLKVNNTAYGSIIGADLPLVKLKHGWDFIPTFYIGYNGSHQGFNHVDMTQNGGQGGFMGTFMKNDFIGSIMAYGGGYNNEMQVAGYTDHTGNWFAGTATKLAYNLHPTKHFTIQPTAFVSYNIFGKQNWGTDYGSMSMNSGLLNGVNVAPGVNLIYARGTWSVYGTFQYMFNINDQVGGRAGNVDLDNVRMRHGYIQYGIGATKTWKDRFNSYVQVVLRNGGRTGIGFQLGLNYSFDWRKPNKDISKHPKTKTVIKSKV